MGRALGALVAGLLFGLGLAIAQMINPLKILGFLDLFGDWDPSLALVMVGAIAVALPGFALLRRWDRPLLETRFQWPSRNDIDRRLLLGSAVFGVGWGLGGYCPGPGFAALALGLWEPLVFSAAMVVGFVVAHGLDRRASVVDG